MSTTHKALPPSKWMPVFRTFLKHLRIQSKEETSLDGMGTELSLWGSQERFLKALSEGLSHNQHKFYFLKSRQLGITTISLAVDLFYLAMFPRTKGALVVDEDRNREQFRNILRNYVQSFPQDFFGDGFSIVKGGDNKYGMRFSNGSQMDFLVAGLKDKESFGDGGGYSLAHFTEVGRYGCEGALRSFEQALSERNPNRLYIYESRAAGPNHWQRMWQQAGKDIYTIRREFIGWWSNPGQVISKADPRWTAYGTLPPDSDERDLIHAVKEMYDHDVTREQLAWYRWRADDEGVDIEVLHAQQPWTEDQAFVVAGATFFHIRLLGQDFDRIGDPNGDVVFRAFRYQMSDSFFDTHIEEMFEGSDPSHWHLRIWEAPVKGAKYVIGMDPAYGRNDNHNNSCISVWRCYADRLVQVAEYATDEDVVLHAARVLAHLAGNYEDCIINLEVTGPGAVVMQELNNLRGTLRHSSNREVVRERKIEDFLTAARWYIYSRPDSSAKPGGVYNFKTGYESKRRALNHLKNCHYDKTLVINSKPLVEEMMGVRMHDNEIGAMGRNNDDRVMAAALAAHAYKEWRQADLMSQNYFYDDVTAREAGGNDNPSNPLGLIVRNYMKMVEQREEEADYETPNTWKHQRGFA